MHQTYVITWKGMRDDNLDDEVHVPLVIPNERKGRKKKNV
jgi:hypothetical protein